MDQSQFTPQGGLAGKIIMELLFDIITNSISLWTVPIYSNRFSATKTFITLPDELQ